MKLNLLIILGLHSLYFILNAQPDFRPGYIVKNSGDTVYGNIDYRGDLLMCSACIFKGKDNVATEYSPNDITAFRFLDSKCFVSKEINYNKVFLEFLIKGKINIYYLRNDEGDHYYIDKDDMELSEIPYSEHELYINNQRKLYESKRHIGILSYYTQDAPGFKSRIQNIHKPEHQNLIKLAEDYHHEVCKDEQCIIYEKKIPVVTISLQPFTGFTKYNVSNSFVNETGAYLYFWAPRTNENIYFKTGLAFLRIAEEGEELRITKIPIQLLYIYKAYSLQPEISGGVNFLKGRIDDYKDIGHTLCLNAGLNYRISRMTSICAGFDCEFTQLRGVIFNNNKLALISYSVTVGLRLGL